MTMSDAQRRDRVNEMKEMVKGQVAMQRYYLSIKQDPDRTGREIDRLTKAIEKMTSDRELLQIARDNAKELYIEACERAEELQNEILMLENQSKIEKLMQLTSDLNGLGLTQEQLTALVAG